MGIFFYLANTPWNMRFVFLATTATPWHWWCSSRCGDYRKASQGQVAMKRQLSLKAAVSPFVAAHLLSEWDIMARQIEVAVNSWPHPYSFLASWALLWTSYEDIKEALMQLGSKAHKGWGLSAHTPQILSRTTPSHAANCIGSAPCHHSERLFFLAEAYHHLVCKFQLKVQNTVFCGVSHMELTMLYCIWYTIPITSVRHLLQSTIKEPCSIFWSGIWYC